MTSAAQPVDLFVIGGGINGCGIARDAAGRGFSVALAEQHDLASGTSSASTKLIHGGLRYLEHYEFRLVRESLMEREVLWAMAPHIIRPLRFVLPHHRGLRPAWLIRLGLFLYDHLGGRKALPGTRALDLTKDEAGRPLQDSFTRGFEYSDGWVDDARLVALNARDAAERGAMIMTRTRATRLHWDGALWTIDLVDAKGIALPPFQARMVINAAGPWVDRVIGDGLARKDVHNVRLVQGSHIVVPRLYAHERAYIFQNADGRIIFAIPYERDFTLIGTTDRDYDGDPAKVAISQEEKSYLCAAASAYFSQPIQPDSIVWTYSGVRPLFDDGASKAQEATRDYVLRDAGGGDAGPMINIFGGKITTYRRLAESVLKRIEATLGARKAAWTATSRLPGGEFPMGRIGDLISALKAEYPFLRSSHVKRLARAYGTRAREFLGDAASLQDLGQHFGADLFAAEIDHMMDREWARGAEDVLWRRSKLGLRIRDAEAIAAIEGYIRARLATR